ncbi:2-C-methyl-D-erythritol 4-phosphate cytidylyltransferase [Paradesulfitobacterium aromaticivorans]
MDEVGVIIPAAGSGTRMGTSLNKQFLMLKGVPVLVHTARIFQSSEFVREIVIVGAREEIPMIRELVAEYKLSKVQDIAPGGATRQESVTSGLNALHSDAKRVVVHDGARPLLPLALLHRFLGAAEGTVAALMAVEPKDTITRIDANGWVVETPAREELRAVQTPQVFDLLILREAHRRAALEGFAGTDDASLVEWLGHPVKVLEGSPENIKLTTPEDLLLAEQILAGRDGDINF